MYTFDKTLLEIMKQIKFHQTKQEINANIEKSKNVNSMILIFGLNVYSVT